MEPREPGSAAPAGDRRHHVRRESDAPGAVFGDLLDTAQQALAQAERAAVAAEARAKRFMWWAGIASAVGAAAVAVAGFLAIRVQVTGPRDDIDGMRQEFAEFRVESARRDTARQADVAAIRAALDKMQAEDRADRELQDWLVQLRCREMRRTMPDLYLSQCRAPLAQPQAFRPQIRAALKPLALVLP